MMRPSIVTRLTRFAWTLIPLLVGILAVLLAQIPFSPGGTVIGINLPLIIVYFWALYRPDLLPPYAIFLIGLFQDLLGGGPVGLWAMVYLIVYAVVLTQRLMLLARGLFVIWLGFIAAAVIGGIVAYGIAALYYGQAVGAAALAMQVGVTVLAYLVVSPVLAFIQRRLLREA
jgi:rod shape-determining protein MreD